MSMNINKLDELKAALTALEGNGIGSCWDDKRDNATLTLDNAIKRYNEIAEEDRLEYDWYECVYGNGGYSRYFVSMKTGNVTFSAYHSYSTKIDKAVALGFDLH